MPGTKPPTFGPTVRLWPADPGVLPPVRRWDVDFPGAGIMRWMGSGDLLELPDDFVLREVLDSGTDETDVRAFVERWGPLSPNGSHALDLLPAGERGGLETHEGSDWLLETEAHHLRALRALAGHWLASVTGGDVRVAWAGEGFAKARSDSMALGWWVDYVNAALSRFQMHVVVEDDGWSRRGWQMAHETCLYEVAVRQLATLASDGDVVRHCANDTCRRPFTRQRGRAVYAARERGVKYCSHRCAKAQAERERRARRKAEA